MDVGFGFVLAWKVGYGAVVVVALRAKVFADDADLDDRAVRGFGG